MIKILMLTAVLMVLQFFALSQESSDRDTDEEKQHSFKRITLTAPVIVAGTGTPPPSDNSLTITYPRQNQKVRGTIKISGKARPTSEIEVTITSVYIGLKRDDRNSRFLPGEGPVNRMNRKLKVKVNRSGQWSTEPIELINKYWREDFTIMAILKEGKTNTMVKVYDDTRPLYID